MPSIIALNKGGWLGPRHWLTQSLRMGHDHAAVIGHLAYRDLHARLHNTEGYHSLQLCRVAVIVVHKLTTIYESAVFVPMVRKPHPSSLGLKPNHPNKSQMVKTTCRKSRNISLGVKTQNKGFDCIIIEENDIYSDTN